MDGKRFAEMRRRAGLSQSQLAEKAGLKLTTIQKWENRSIENAYIGLLKKAADAMGCKVDDLI